MAELTIDKVYAAALYQVAREAGRVEPVVSDAQEMGELFKKEPELKRFIDSPVVSAGEKKQVLETIFQQQICPELLNFLMVLVDKGRTRHFDRILKRLIWLSMQEEGVSQGTACSVEPLTEEQLRRLEEQTGKVLRRKVRLSNALDPSLIGGVKILIEGRMLDASFKKQLDRFRDALQSQ